MNSIGHIFRFTSFGESHGSHIGGVIDGCPAGLLIDFNFLQEQLLLRSPRAVCGATERVEADEVEFLSGISNGVTLGSPIAFIIKNQNTISAHYDDLEHTYRPGHADYTYQHRYGIRDFRGGGRASARETVARVVAGAIAKMWLKQKEINIVAYTDQMGDIYTNKTYSHTNNKEIYNSVVRCPDSIVAQNMIQLISDAKSKGDSIGGAVRCVINGLPAGIGNPIFNKIQADLAYAMMSIPAAKGFEYGLGFKAASSFGSESNDAMEVDDNNNVSFKTNRAGGLLGGITTGEDIYFRVAFKPVSSISLPQNTVNDKGENVSVAIQGRHDVCIVPRATIIVESMAAIVIINHLLMQG